MKIEISSLYFGNSTKVQEGNQSIKSKENKNNTGSFFAGDLNGQQDEASLKKNRAQKQAMRVLQNQFNNDKNIDEVIKDRNQHQIDLSSEADNAQKELNKLNNKCEELKKTYGVKDDSEEQKNLELLEKKLDSKNILTDDERKQLSNMGPITEYQQAVLDYDKIKKTIQETIDDSITEIANEGRTIDAIKLEKLKTHPMIDARQQADGLLEKATEEAIAVLMDQVKDKIDQDMDTTKEKIEKASEEKEKEQERIENNNHNDVELSKITQSGMEQEQIQMELKEIIVNEKVLDEDIKGIVVDETI